MPNYDDLRPLTGDDTRDYARVFPMLTDVERIRCIDGLLRLRSALAAAPVVQRRTQANLALASWNIKEFGHTTQRLPEAYFYIAEVLSAFDLIAVQEVKGSLKDFDILMRLMGPGWAYLVNDITDGVDGNRERSAYIYNTYRVRQTGLAGEIGLWEALTADSPLGMRQLKRAPYVTEFVAGWKRFAIVNLHLHPGEGRNRDADGTLLPSDVEIRGEEVRLLLKALEAKSGEHWAENLIILGDMNLYERKDDATIARFADARFFECEGLRGADTNASQSEAFDRMFFRQNDYFRLGAMGGAECGGVFDVFAHVYRDADVDAYRAEMLADYTGSKDLAGDPAALLKYYRETWRRNQVSDHFPIWAELMIDDSDKFLGEKRAEIVGMV